MKLVVLGVFGFVAASLITGLVAALSLGASSKIVGGLFIALSILMLATFVLSRLRGVLNLELSRRLPRALLTHDRR